MADSIVYEHDGFNYDADGFGGSYRLVRYNGQTISVTIENTGTKIDSAQNIVISNLDTGEKITSWRLYPYSPYALIENLKVFMYSDSVLFIGFESTNYLAWAFNLARSKWKDFNNFFSPLPISKIIPVGQKYIMLIPKFNNWQIKILTWDNLLHLNNLSEPVFTIDFASRLYPINWSSSAIGHLSSVEFVQTFGNSEHVKLLDKNFNMVMDLNIKDLFPNYQLDELNKLDEPDEFTKDNVINEVPTVKITVNANCLLYLEHKPKCKITKNKHIIISQTHCYCWDFTANKPVTFPIGKLNYNIRSVVPFRNYQNQIKCFVETTHPLASYKFYAKVYDSNGLI